MIKLYQYPPAFGLPNASPFCMKLETYLRMTELPFEAVHVSDPRKAPKGKLPYIEDGGKTIADSTLIIEYLKRAYGDPLDGGLDSEQCAVALAMQRLMEESLYWALLYSRWIEPEGFARTSEAFFGKLPPPLRWVVPGAARRAVERQMHGHGLGRHAREEIYEIGQRDIGALADFLGPKLFLLGERPSSIDACAYAFIANLIWAPVDGPLKQYARGFGQFPAYCQRMRQRYYAQ